MQPISPTGRVRPGGLIVIVLLLAGCASSTATPSPSPVPATTPASPAIATPTAASPITASPTPAPSATATPVPSTAGGPRPGVTTPVPPAEDVAWTSLSFAPLAAADPVASIRSMARFQGGFVAVGAPATNHDGSARTPVWTSTDGGTWTPLDPAVLGPSTAVLALGPLGNAIVAITATADTTQCGVDEDNCYNPAPPLQAWTSTDGATWRAHAVPGSFKANIESPVLAAIGNGGIAVAEFNDPDWSTTVSTDAQAWSDPARDPFGKDAGLTRLAALRDGFVAIGGTGGDEHGSAVAWSSPDGTAWQAHKLPVAKVTPGVGTSADGIDGAGGGLLVTGSTFEAPGQELWWSSADGAAWSRRGTYAPLGVWNGEGEGTGLIPNGSVSADGERILAMRRDGGTAAWQSVDGGTWQPLPVTGLAATGKNDWPVFGLEVFPAGVVVDDGDGHAFFGTPAS